MTTVSLNVEKWLRLCRQAEQAALMYVPNVAADELVVSAGRLTTVTDPLTSAFMISLATSFRWDCTAFGMAAPQDRAVMADGLKAKAILLRQLLEPSEPPPSLAAAMPVPSVETLPSWQRRADIGG